MVNIAKEFKFPDVGEGIHEGTIVKWHVKIGDIVVADKTIVEVETDKAIVELPSPVSGKVQKINFKEGDLVKVNETLIIIEDNQSEIIEPVSEVRILATPSTRNLARELGVDITKIQGSGNGGRITDEDIKSQATNAINKKTIPDNKSAILPLPQLNNIGIKIIDEPGDQKIRLSNLRKVIADKMTYSKTHIPHACGMDYIDVTKLVQLREKEKDILKSRGIHLTYLPFIIKAAAIALEKKPEFNANYDENNSIVIIKKKINIGIAVDTKEGLMAPVIKDVITKSISEIAKEIENLAKLSRERKLKLEDLQGGTFTITNVGSVGGMYSTPIINPPEIAIMGVHRIRDSPMVVEGKIEPRKIMGISLCFDHRVVDGAAATEFMNLVKIHLEDPDLLLVDMS